MTTKICNHCGLEKDEEEFNWRYKVLGIRNPACRDCQHAFNKDYYEGDAKERDGPLRCMGSYIETKQ